MPPALILGIVGGLLVLAFLANRVFRVTRIPDVVLLINGTRRFDWPGSWTD